MNRDILSVKERDLELAQSPNNCAQSRLRRSTAQEMIGKMNCDGVAGAVEGRYIELELLVPMRRSSVLGLASSLSGNQ